MTQKFKWTDRILAAKGFDELPTAMPTRVFA